MILELPGSSYDTIKKLYYATEMVPLTLGGEKIADVVITNFIQRYATRDDTRPLGLTVELRAIVKIELPPKKFKEGAYYWVKLKKEYLNPDRPNENAWVVARYTEETDEDYEVFYACGLYCPVEPEDLEEIGEEIKRGSED